MSGSGFVLAKALVLVGAIALSAMYFTMALDVEYERWERGLLMAMGVYVAVFAATFDSRGEK